MSSPLTHLAFSRRPLVEQRLIRDMRRCAHGGGRVDESDTTWSVPSKVLKRLARFTRLAASSGYFVQQPEAPFVSADELRLVEMLAMAQRVRFSNRIDIEPELNDLLFGCAAALDSVGIRLPSISLVAAEHARLRLQIGAGPPKAVASRS